jgi:pyruvate formate lyase activating enzyme
VPPLPQGPDKRQVKLLGKDEFIVIKTTLVDYPGKVAACVFLPGCHLRCPFCHNPDLVIPGKAPGSGAEGNRTPYENMDGFEAFLRRRASVLGGVVFSGGEALLHPRLAVLVQMVKNHGLKVKVDTAGLLPGPLGHLIGKGLVDYVAMDLKTAPARYGELGWTGTGTQSAEVLLNRTLDLLMESGIDYEVRTTVVPPLADAEVLALLAEITREVPRWVWQTYRPGITLNPDWGNLKAPDEDGLRSLLREMNLEGRVVVK